MNKFSVLTSLYNSEKFLDSYFNTIFSQELLPSEIILIDDTNNPKNLVEIVKNKCFLYNFANIKIIKNDNNLGPAISLNKGLEVCSNNLIFRLDVDDLWKSNHTKTMLNYYEKDNKFLIYAVSLKKKNFLTNLKCDEYLINENHFVHSSWLINRNILKTFRYHMQSPKIALEDYFTLLYYTGKGFIFFFSHNQTVIYQEVILSHGQKYKNNPKYLKIRKFISKKFLEVYFFKNKTLLKKINFFLLKYGVIKFIILQIWILDRFFIKKFIK